MKRIGKRISSILLAVAMIFSMATTVSAEESKSYTLTIKDDKNGQNGETTYNIYKILDGKIDADLITYTVNKTNETPVKKALENANIKTLADITQDNVQTLLNALLGVKNELAVTKENVTAGTYKLDPGYYLVVATGKASTDDTDGVDNGGTVTSPILIAVPAAASTTTAVAELKSSNTSVEKKIVEGDNKVDTNDVSIGQEINYQLKATIPAYGTDVDPASITFWLTDTPSKGITIKKDTFKADKGTFKTVENEDGSYTLKFDYSTLEQYAGQEVTVTVTGILNEDAIVSSGEAYDGNDNKVTLTYTNNYYTTETSDINDIVKSFTYALSIEKVDEATNEVLKGAEFEVRDSEDNVVATGTTDDNGVLYVKGLDEGTYTIKETKAPEGYSIMEGTITVTIVGVRDENNNLTGAYTVNGNGTTVQDENGKVVGNTATDVNGHTAIKVTVQDAKGLNLPGTGGMGTTIFTVAGISLIVLAGGLFVLYSRKQRSAK